MKILESTENVTQMDSLQFVMDLNGSLRFVIVDVIMQHPPLTKNEQCALLQYLHMHNCVVYLAPELVWTW